MSVITLNKIDSTNAYIKRNYKSLRHFDVVIANSQSKGKGRNTHKWDSEPNKNLLCSILLNDKILISNGPILSIYTAIAIVKTLNKLKLHNVSIKWPNDVYVKNKKICGILLESKSINNKLECIILGIGLNLNQTKFKQEYFATSYKLETNKDIKPTFVLSILIKELKKVLSSKYSYTSFINKHNFLKNKQVNVTINNKKVVATALDIDKTGDLKVKYNNKIYKINSNEVNLIVR